LAKENGFSDLTISKIINQKNQIIHKKCLENKILPSYKMVDTCSGEIKAVTPYYYSTYDSNLHENAEHKTNKKKILIIGSGPIRIGQGIEFDYCNVHAIWALQKKGYEVIIVNSNPETVSTDFDIANKLYFEPLDYEDIKNIIDCERVYGVIVQFGGQTPIKIAQYLAEDNIKILGSSINAINGAENRKFFDKILNDEKIPRAKGITVLKLKDALNGIRKIGYPVIIRPSFVLGGQGMNVLYDDNDTKIYFNRIKEQGIDDNPVLIDQFLEGKEFEIDGICDGEDILIPGFIEHVEPAGVHSGDSMTIYPSLTLPKDVIAKATIYAKKLALALNIIGMFNIQFVYYANTVYVIELNPRSSRTIPYISKVTNLPLIDIAIDVILGKKLKNMKYGTNEYKRSKLYSVKMPIFSNDKIKGTDIYLGPEMKSTGEILGIDKNINNSLFKVFSGAGVDFNNKKNVIISINNRDKPKIIKLASKLVEKGYKILATNNTQKYLLKNHVNAKAIEKNIKGISKLIAQEKISFVVNTPTIGKSADRFGYQLRRMASENKIQLFTSIDTLSALLSAMDSNKNIDVYEIFNKAK
jgi:carbamoyl-phosphate synthase large subunit